MLWPTGLLCPALLVCLYFLVHTSHAGFRVPKPNTSLHLGSLSFAVSSSWNVLHLPGLSNASFWLCSSVTLGIALHSIINKSMCQYKDLYLSLICHILLLWKVAYILNLVIFISIYLFTLLLHVTKPSIMPNVQFITCRISHRILRECRKWILENRQQKSLPLYGIVSTDSILLLISETRNKQ